MRPEIDLSPGCPGGAPDRRVSPAISCTAAAGRDGFTLLELLVVIAVIGLLAGLIFPAVGAARRAAQAARTKVQFTQWAAAIESFRSEYGYYPVFDASGFVNGGVTGAPGGDHPFHDVLAGRRRDGSALPASGPAATGVQNPKHLAFYAFTPAEFTDSSAPAANLLQDASGNTSIAVLVDRNLDGAIRFGAGQDYDMPPAVGGWAPPREEFPSSGLRVGVAFYAPAPRSGPDDRRFIFSWK